MINRLLKPKERKAATRAKREGAEKKPGTSAIKLQIVFNQFIRYRDCGPSGGHCFTCGIFITRGHNSNASHFKSGDKRHWGTRYDERFVHAACIHCNWTLEGNQVIYAQKLIEKFGPGIIDEFHLKNKLNPKKPGELWFKEQIKVYKAKVKDLE